MNCEKNVIRSLVNKGSFGPVTFIDVKFKQNENKGIQFASLIKFATLTVNDGTTNKDINLFIKKNHESENILKVFNFDIYFQNEVLMYSKILPLIQADQINLFPKFYQNEINVPENILIFEDLASQGFVISKEKIFLDFEHVEMALKHLAKFHGLSYLAKRKNKDVFLSLAKDLKEIKLNNVELNKFAGQALMRGIQPLLDRDVQVKTLNRLIKKFDNLVDVAEKLIEPEEPFSVVCHGDFCRNNMVYKYENDKLCDIRFFDLQNSIYASPAVDITFFLYLNTTAKMREIYWDKFLNIYWDSLNSFVDSLEFNYDQFLNHFGRRAIYGYIPNSYFLPSLIGGFQDFEKFCLFTLEERSKVIMLNGGEEGTVAITDIVQHLLEKGYIHKFLEL